MSYDANVVDKFVDIEKKILETFQYIFFYKPVDEIKYRKYIDFLSVLLKKENILISKLPQNDDDIILILDIVLENKDNYFEDDYERYLVLERFQSIMNDLLIRIDENIYEDDDFEYDLIDSPKNRKAIKVNLDAQFIKSLDKLKNNNSDLFSFFTNTQFNIAYKSRQNTNQLFNLDFNTTEMSYLDDNQLCRKLGLNNDDYINLKNDVVYDSLESLVQDYLELLDGADNENILKQFFLQFKYYINIISNDGLKVFKSFFDRAIMHKNDDIYVQELNVQLTNEYEKRELHKIEYNRRRVKLDSDVVDRLINLIKLEGEIYSVFCKIDFKNINDELFDKLSDLLEMENKIVCGIKIDKSNESMIKSMIEDDLEFFLPFNQSELMIISERLFNILDYFYYLDASPAQNYKSFDLINKNHIINSFKKFIEIYEDVSEDKKNYDDILRKILFVNKVLTTDYVVARGNYLLIDSLSNKLVSRLAKISVLEYEYDKNEQLYERANKIMDFICNSNLVIDDEYLIFLLCEIEDIRDNMSLDYMDKFIIYEFPDSFNDDLFGQMISDIIRDKKNVHSIRRNR